MLTTLHTNTAADAVVRLIDLGVEDFLLVSALRCIVGQRLVRKLCERCRGTTPQLPAGLRALVEKGVSDAAPGETFMCGRLQPGAGGPAIAAASASSRCCGSTTTLRSLIRGRVDVSEIEAQPGRTA